MEINMPLTTESSALKVYQNYLPVHEPKKAIDGIPSSKYLNFDKDGSGLIIEIDRCQLTGFNLTSGDDNPSRDPKSYELYGSDDGRITYRMVHKGTIETFTQRLQRREIRLPNPSFYKQYKIIFDTIVDSTITDAFQIAEIELIGSEITTTWPEYVTYYKLLQHLAKENEQTAFELPLTDIFDYSELPLARDTQIRNLADRPEINLHQNDLSGWHGDKKMWSSINETIKAKVGMDPMKTNISSTLTMNHWTLTLGLNFALQGVIAASISETTFPHVFESTLWFHSLA